MALFILCKLILQTRMHRWGTPILGQYGYAMGKPLFSALATPKDSTFSTWVARRDPPFYVIFSSKTPFCPCGAALKAPLFSVRDRSLSPHV